MNKIKKAQEELIKVKKQRDKESFDEMKKPRTRSEIGRFQDQQFDLRRKNFKGIEYKENKTIVDKNQIKGLVDKDNINPKTAIYTTSGSSFKSEQDIINSLLKLDEKPPSEVKIINPDEKMIIPELTLAQKACVLARKYKKEHYIMKSMSKKNHKWLTQPQIDLIFDIARQCKQAKQLTKDEK